VNDAPMGPFVASALIFKRPQRAPHDAWRNSIARGCRFRSLQTLMRELPSLDLRWPFWRDRARCTWCR